MLAQRLETPEEFIEKHGGAFAVEYKLDGERLQVHKHGDEITLFSRRQEVITSQFPDVVENILKYITANEAILDGEVVAIEPGSMLDTPYLPRRALLEQIFAMDPPQNKILPVP